MSASEFAGVLTLRQHFGAGESDEGVRVAVGLEQFDDFFRARVGRRFGKFGRGRELDAGMRMLDESAQFVVVHFIASNCKVVSCKKLSENYSSFSGSVNNLLIPLLNGKSVTEKERNDLVIPILDLNVRKLEEIIKEMTMFLPNKEKGKIINHIDSHKLQTNSPDEIYSIEYL